MKLHSQLQYDPSYKFIQLTPEIMDVLKDSNDSLTFKSARDDAELVLCSKSKTFQIKQKNHSNTVLMMKRENPDEWIGYTSFHSELEPKVIQGSINISSLPIYTGTETELVGVSVQELVQRSPISEREFDQHWFRLNGCEIDGVACTLANEIITRTLHITLMSILAEGLNMEELSLIDTYRALGDDDTKIEVMETVLKKFSTTNKEPYCLKKNEIGVWYGIEALRQCASSGLISVDDFLIKWKSDLPPYFQCDMDLKMLLGHYCMPLPDRIQYLAKNALPDDAKSRFKMLFKIQSTWGLEEIVPYIQELNVKNLKIDNFIMKFARRKTIGKKVVVTAR